jgi:hypothetical protein
MLDAISSSFEFQCSASVSKNSDTARDLFADLLARAAGTGFHQVAYTPDGDSKGENPKLGSGGYKTDLPGGIQDAEAVLTGLSRLAGDDKTATLPNPLRPDVLYRSYPSGIKLRIGSDLRPRIDIPAGVFSLTKPETIHFTGGKGNMCPTN